MDLENFKKQLYIDLKSRFSHLSRPYKDAPDWAITDFFAKQIEYYFKLGKESKECRFKWLKSFEFYISVLLGVIIGLIIK